MITLIIKAMFAIARMSKKASAIYCSLLTVFFLSSLGLLLFGILLIDQPNPSELSFLLTTLGAIMMFLVVATIAVTTIASNYVRKNPHKDPKIQKKDDSDKKETE